MKYKVFVDGQEGTTRLKIHDYLSARADIEILYIKDRYLRIWKRKSDFDYSQA